MKISTPQINITNARNDYIPLSDGSNTYNKFKSFSQYSPAYVITNEDIRWVSGLTANEAKKVLTVTGSGDQPIFYSINGATEIDMFDISFCAKTIADIKTIALHKLTRQDYIQLLNDLHTSRNISSISNMSQILPELPKNSQQFIKQMNYCNIFSNGFGPYNYTEHLPTNEEFETMKEKISKPFNFIWTDIDSLHSYLTKEYDVINLSNILEYMNKDQIHKTLASLKNYIRPKGYIIAQTGNLGIYENRQAFYEASKKFKKWAKLFSLQKDKTNANSEMIAILQRTR